MKVAHRQLMKGSPQKAPLKDWAQSVVHRSLLYTLKSFVKHSEQLIRWSQVQQSWGVRDNMPCKGAMLCKATKQPELQQQLEV